MGREGGELRAAIAKPARCRLSGSDIRGLTSIATALAVASTKTRAVQSFMVVYSLLWNWLCKRVMMQLCCLYDYDKRRRIDWLRPCHRGQDFLAVARPTRARLNAQRSRMKVRHSGTSVLRSSLSSTPLLRRLLGRPTSQGQESTPHTRSGGAPSPSSCSSLRAGHALASRGGHPNSKVGGVKKRLSRAL